MWRMILFALLIVSLLCSALAYGEGHFEAMVNSSDGEEAEVLNLLIVGHDTESNSTSGTNTTRSDIMLLVSVNQTAHSITITSFLRDLYLPIPGVGENRLNAAYSNGGVELLKETIYENFGIPIHRTVEVDYLAFQELVDAIGGVEVTLDASEVAYFRGENGRWAGGHVYEDLVADEPLLMNGEMLLEYVRMRHNANGSDFTRQEHVQAVLMKLIKTCLKGGPGTILTAANTLIHSEHVSMDLDLGDLYSVGQTVLGWKLTDDLSYDDLMDSIQRYKVPESGQYTDEITSAGQMVLVIKDMEEVRQTLHDHLYGMD